METRRASDPYSRQVFLNCPIDDEYRPLGPSGKIASSVPSIFEHRGFLLMTYVAGQDKRSKSRQEIGDVRNSRIDCERTICLFESDGMGARATIN
jgi:hypothetical protein